MTDVLRYFHPVAASRSLSPGPLRAEIQGRAFALFRDKSGTAAALLDACPHRFAPLSKGRVRADGRLACAYHGWNFDADGKGQSPSQPTLARCDTRALRVVEKYGYVWMANREPTPLLKKPAMEHGVPDLALSDFVSSGSHATLSPAPLGAVLERIDGDPHLSGLRRLFGWTEGAPLTYETRSLAGASEEVCTLTQRPSPLAAALGIRAGDELSVTWSTRFEPVSAIVALSWTDPATRTERPFALRVAIFLVPETLATTRIHSFFLVRGLASRARMAGLLLRGASRIATGSESRIQARPSLRRAAQAHQQHLLHAHYLRDSAKLPGQGDVSP